MTDNDPEMPSRMSSMRQGFIVIVAVVGVASSSARGQGFEKGVLDTVKDATVFIKLKQGGQLRSTGSGFVMRATGDKLLIMTNRHVVTTDPAEQEGAAPELSIVLRSGTPQQQEVSARLLAFDTRKIRDLAVLEVQGVKSPPRPIFADVTAAESEFFETMPAYALGFPRGGMIVGNANANPAVTVNAMTISSLRRDEQGKLARVQFAGSMIEGNSGGPVVDPKGRLVGVVVERLRGEAVGFAIPPSVVAAFLAGDISELLSAELVGSSGPDAQVKLVVRLVDPLNRVKKVFVRHAPQTGPPDAIPRDARGTYAPLAGGTSVSLMVNNGVASGTFALPIHKPDDRKVLFQWILNDSERLIGTSKPFPVQLPDRPGPIEGLGLEEKTKVVSLWSCEANVADGVKMVHTPGFTTIDLPGGVALNNSPTLNLYNAPCALVKVNGDFVVSVGVENTFDPGSEGVVLPTGKKFPYSFQSAGILVWQDEKNFVRLERVKQSDGKISVNNRVLVEVYKNGKTVAVHYIDVPEQPTGLACVRRGGSIRLLFALPPKQLSVFHEMALDLDKDVYVGLAAANLSKRPFQAKFETFNLRTLEGSPIDVKPVKLTKLVDSGYVKLPDGTRIFEGAGLKVASPENAPVVPQTNMADYKGEWSDNRQLLWNNEKAGQALTLELPVDADGKYEIKAKFTQAPNYAIVKLDLDGRPLSKGDKIDFYAQEVKPTKLLSMGTLPLNKGKRKLTITVFNKNPKSSGYHFGLDEIQLIPVK